MQTKAEDFFREKDIDMKALRKELWFNTPTRVAFINITDKVRMAIKESAIKEGLCLVNAS